ncbi:copper-translocating P-type ATPase [Apilactobacillus apisilvae]|uniref:P-type Cu(+) transporter n=2 Tax=Apilactobacillus apisilvae TaxID=2923364 RepID=A0ABY4PJZ1_9LACO|nr:heavy metal translocating P-type ATPase [Apilactobacillus apisilvae]UQS85749.1 copper-translocating P-type ATPase [Apilactobacillus apisilvae]
MDHDMHHMDHDMHHMDHDMNGMDHSQMMNHGGHMMDMGDMKKKFWISLILTIPIILMSPMMGMQLPFQLTFPGSNFIVLILGSILFFYCSTPFFSGAKGEIKNKKPEMMSLITLGISVAYVYSVYSVVANDILNITPKVNDFFWELSTLIVIMLLGHRIEMNSIMNAGSAINKLSKLLPDSAHLISENGDIKDVSTNKLAVGNSILIKSGEQIPADGKIYDGSTSVNESLVTGESRSVNKQTNNDVIGGSINGDGTIKVKISGTGSSGYLSKVKNMVQEAQSSKSKTETAANQVASYLFYAALVVAIIAFVAWSFVRGVSFAIPVTVTVLIIACPHALGLAVPLITSRTTSLAATNGLLIRNKNALDGINDIKYALMDKTGTLTEGKFKVNGYVSLDQNYSDDEIVKIAASVEQNSNHPLANGIAEIAKQKGLSLYEVINDTQITGYGVKGTLNNNDFAVVSAAYLDANNIKYTAQDTQNYLNDGNSVSYVIKDNVAIGFIAEGDSIKKGSKAMVQYLLSQNITPVMLTGDNKDAAAKVASLLGISEFKAQLLPEDKQKNVLSYQKQGKTIFIGDGINDAPSLTQSDIGIAIGSGTDVAIDSADVVLVNSDPNDIVSLVKLAKNSHRKMIQNLWWGAGYNILALPLAAGILGFAGIMLDPMVGAIVMSLSTVIVALNALTLKIK